MVRGIRGAITVKANSESEIINATKKLLMEMLKTNELIYDDIVSIFFSATNDLNKAFPAKAARMLGLKLVPLFCCQEMNVEGSLKRCIRVLIHVNTDKKPDQIRHVYLEEAKNLRPDLD
ncbi:MAG: chorismate mutase [Thermosediminibacterales bacterium]|nr:chorismate mutase [Thermosediminibacterales bacterium]